MPGQVTGRTALESAVDWMSLGFGCVLPAKLLSERGEPEQAWLDMSNGAIYNYFIHIFVIRNFLSLGMPLTCALISIAGLGKWDQKMCAEVADPRILISFERYHVCHVTDQTDQMFPRWRT